MRTLLIAARFWPDLDNMSGQPRATGIANVVGCLASLPFAVAGLAWLAAVTNPALIHREWPVLLLLLGLYLLAERFNFFVFVQVRAGQYSDFAGSLSSVILWSGVLILGPSALWPAVLALAADAARGWPRQTTAERWSRARNYSLNLVEITLARLIALAVYQQWGGVIPLPGLAPGTLLPALGATVVQYVLSKLVWAAYILYAGSIHALGAPWSPRRTLVKFAALAFGLPGLAEPFALLAAGLYVQDGLPIYLFFVSGLFLVSALAQQLSRAAERSQQQSSELEKLEQLGRALIDAPPDASTLAAVLAEHVPAMFSYAGLEIRVAAGRVLLHDPPYWPPLAEPIWDWLCSQATARYFLPGDERPWDGRPATDAVVVAPILDTESGRNSGGVYVVLNPVLQRLDARAAAALVPATQSLAAQVASALHRTEVYAETLAHQRVLRELELAGQIQATFLPADLPAVAGWQIAAMLQPARQTSGDFYDVILLPGGRLGLVVADVADKGMGAALYMALSRTLIRTYALEFAGSPERVLAAANRRILADTRADQFVTVFYGILDPSTGRLAYCNAGHPPPYVLSSRDRRLAGALGRTGIPLGIDEEAAWQQAEIELAPGDVLVLYTDGVTEAQNAHEELWGAQRLVEAAQARLDLPAPQMLAALVGDVAAFSGETAQYDDLTLMLVRRELGEI